MLRGTPILSILYKICKANCSECSTIKCSSEGPAGSISECLKQLENLIKADPNTAEAPLTLEEVLTTFQQLYPKFEHFLSHAFMLGTILGAVEVFSLIYDSLKLFKKYKTEQDKNIDKALGELKSLFWKRTQYMVIGGASGVGLGWVLYRALQSLKIFPTISLSTWMIGSAGVGMAAGGYLFSSEYKLRLTNLYNALKVDMTPFWPYAEDLGEQKLKETLYHVQRLLNFMKRQQNADKTLLPEKPQIENSVNLIEGTNSL